MQESLEASLQATECPGGMYSKGRCFLGTQCILIGVSLFLLNAVPRSPGYGKYVGSAYCSS